MLGHFRAYGMASGDAYWAQAVEALQGAVEDTQENHSPMTGLFPQYLMGGQNLPGANVLSDGGHAPDFFGEVGMLPLRMAADLVASGDPRTKAALTKINAWIQQQTGGDPLLIVNGYELDGSPIGDSGDMSFIAPLASIAIFDAANQAWLDASWQLMAEATTTNQTVDTAHLLGLLVVTGNWWQP
jgi:hypothetical protein